MIDHTFALDCGCGRCSILAGLMWREAAASVRLSHDPDVQTITLLQDSSNLNQDLEEGA